MADEVQSGAGRTGRMWAVDHWDVKPDILISAKGIASGMPLGAMIARADLMEHWGPGAHGSTFGGNPVACAAALATLDLLEDGLVDNARDRGEQALRQLRPLLELHPGLVARCPRQGPDARCRVRLRPTTPRPSSGRRSSVGCSYSNAASRRSG